ncbi:hypothetical protein PT313_02910, partial [Metamycoplasma hyosynoviae]|uniref:hypothetical protein n=1 Tax=Metamycoplasma hyosynoviae TaxID=29559 RepID=UPI00235E570C
IIVHSLYRSQSQILYSSFLIYIMWRPPRYTYGVSSAASDVSTRPEHHNPPVPQQEALAKFIHYNKDAYYKYIQKIGNFTLLDKKSNIRNSNRMGNEKQSKNRMCIITSGDDEGLLLPIKNPLPNDWNDISRHIDKRSDQLIDIICKIYEYEENIE